MSKVIADLLKGSELSEDTQKQVSEAFETAVNEAVEAKLAEEKEARDAANEVSLQEAIEAKTVELEEAQTKHINEEVIPAMNEQVDKYLSYVANEWLGVNKIEVENGVKIQMAESFLAGTKDLLGSYDLNITENVDKLEEAKTATDEATAKLDESLAKQADLSNQVEVLKRDAVISEAAKSLTESQKEKIQEASAKLSFDDAESFGIKIKELIESTIPADQIDEEIEVKEDKKIDEGKTFSSPYLKSLSEALDK